MHAVFYYFPYHVRSIHYIKIKIKIKYGDDEGCGATEAFVLDDPIWLWCPMMTFLLIERTSVTSSNLGSSQVK